MAASKSGEIVSIGIGGDAYDVAADG